MILKKIKNNNGFTLIEIIIGMFVISIISLTFFNITNLSIIHNAKNEKDIKLLNIAQSEIESLRNQIKLSKSDITIYVDENNSTIKIPDNDDIIWKKNNEETKKETIEIKLDGIYKDYIATGEGNNSVIQYNKSINGDEYLVKLSLSREKKASKYLYNIQADIKALNSNITNRVATLSTSVLSK